MGSTVDLTASRRPASQEEPGATLPWVEIAWFAAILGLCFAPVLYAMGYEWFNDEDMGHGIFVPVVAGWLVWNKREALSRIPIGSNPLGLGVVLLGAMMLAAGTLGAEMFIARIGFLVSLTGAILYLGGTAMVLELAFPLFLLLFMVRIPAIIYNQITFPLQLLASSIAERAIWMLGIPVIREGNVLELPSQRLNVVQACSGIRSLLSLSFLSLVYGALFDSKSWMRWVLLAATIPIAVAANALRVTMTGVLGEYNKELAEGIFHKAEGLIIFFISLVCLTIVHQSINRLYKLAHRGK